MYGYFTRRREPVNVYAAHGGAPIVGRERTQIGRSNIAGQCIAKIVWPLSSRPENIIIYGAVLNSPSRVIEQPERISRKLIRGERNVERCCCVIERFSIDRFIHEFGAKHIARN